MKIYILKFQIPQEKFSDAKKRIQNDRYVYENSFRIKKKFMEYLVRSQNVKFADFGFKHFTEIL